MDAAVEVRQIVAATDLYDVLGVPHSAGDAELRERFRQLGALCRPGQHLPAPDAPAAFLALARAYSVLADPRKRTQYDKLGAKGLAKDLSATEAEALFHEVLKGHRQATGPSWLQRQWASLSEKLFPMLIALAVVGLCYTWFYGGKKKLFALHRHESSGFTVKRRTAVHDIPYYVANTFPPAISKNATKLKDMERQVYRDYINELRSRCNAASAPNRYGNRGDTSSCNEVQRLTSRFGH